MLVCPDCAAETADDALVCAACGALIWGEKLARIYEESRKARTEKNLDAVLAALTLCRKLLPEGTRQRAQIDSELEEVTHRINSRLPTVNPESLVKPEFESTRDARPHVVIASAFRNFFKGFIRPVTIISLIVWIGSLSYLVGWQAALAFGLLIYVHEMGHIFVIQYFGYGFSWPVFVPFLGAFVLHGNQMIPRYEKMAISLGGPLLGSIISFVILLAWQFADLPPAAHRLANVNLLINYFNLLPASILDGSRIAENCRRSHFVATVVLLAVATVAGLNGFALVMAGGWLVRGLIAWNSTARLRRESKSNERAASVVAGLNCALMLASAIALEFYRENPSLIKTVE